MKTSLRNKNVSTHIKKRSAEKLLKGCDTSAGESKKSLMSMQDNASDFSSVKMPKDRNAATLELLNGPLTQIIQDDYEATPVKGQTRFKDRSGSSSQRKQVESQPALERNQSNLQMNTSKQSFRKMPNKELSAKRLANAPIQERRHGARQRSTSA